MRATARKIIAAHDARATALAIATGHHQPPTAQPSASVMPRSIRSSVTLSRPRPKLEYRWRMRASSPSHESSTTCRKIASAAGGQRRAPPPAPREQRARQRADHGVGHGDLVGRRAERGQVRRQPQRHRPDHVGVAEAVVGVGTLQERALARGWRDRRSPRRRS
jgi:hypothetical protein